MTLNAIKSNIQYLIEQYEQNIMMLEQDIKESDGIGCNLLIGQLRANKEIHEHLNDLLDENNYDDEEDNA